MYFNWYFWYKKSQNNFSRFQHKDVNRLRLMRTITNVNWKSQLHDEDCMEKQSRNSHFHEKQKTRKKISKKQQRGTVKSPSTGRSQKCFLYCFIEIYFFHMWVLISNRIETKYDKYSIILFKMAKNKLKTRKKPLKKKACNGSIQFKFPKKTGIQRWLNGNTLWIKSLNTNFRNSLNFILKMSSIGTGVS